MTTTAIGVDIGGTRVRVGVVTDAGAVCAHAESRLPTAGDPEPLRELVARQTEHVLSESGVTPEVAGVALPGVWDRDTGIMRKAVNLPRLEGINIERLFSAALGRPVLLEADTNAGVWGQWRRLEPRPERLVYISLGTGVGGSVILDGHIVRHTRGGAGHFGFLIVDTSPGAPGGRNNVPGCLSALVAGPALHLAATGHSDPEAIGAEPLPDDLLQSTSRALAIGIMNLVHIYAPDAVALGGGVIDNHPELVDHTRVACGLFQSSLIPPGLRIERAPLSTHDAGVIGAALLALRYHGPGDSMET